MRYASDWRQDVDTAFAALRMTSSTTSSFDNMGTCEGTTSIVAFIAWRQIVADRDEPSDLGSGQAASVVFDGVRLMTGLTESSRSRSVACIEKKLSAFPLPHGAKEREAVRLILSERPELEA